MERILFQKELAQLAGPGMMMKSNCIKNLNNVIYFKDSPVNILKAFA